MKLMVFFETKGDPYWKDFVDKSKSKNRRHPKPTFECLECVVIGTMRIWTLIIMINKCPKCCNTFVLHNTKCTAEINMTSCLSK